MRRLPDWSARLAAFIDATRHAPFVSGRQDCALWALRAADAMCGTHDAHAIVGQYADDDGAIAYAATRGWRTGADACREVCGEPLPRVALAIDGDVCFRPSPPWRFGLTTVRVGDWLWGPSERGLFAVPFRAALLDPRWSAFPVGRAIDA